MSTVQTKEADVAALIDRVAQAASALISGKVRRYMELVPSSADYTLMSPFGGEPIRGYNNSPENIAAQERFFTGPGEATIEVVQTYASGDLIVLAVIERQHGVVGSLPEQDLSLRVTLVFRRDGAEWRLVHRHADPLVHGITMHRLAELLRGD